jgi:carbon-monoxide dehydrogenase iron sulfur subunit
MGKVIDRREEVCIGCRLCEVHCLVQHSQSKDLIHAYKREQPKAIPRVRVEEQGPLSFAVQCFHCEEPLCAYSCLTGALRKMEDGTVLLDEDKCIGCWTCVMACPYGAITMDTVHKVAVKCDLCPGRDVPACVENCPNQALILVERGPSLG